MVGARSTTEPRMPSEYNNTKFLSFIEEDNGNGATIISTKSVFDREKQKYYCIPITMWDMRGTNSPLAMTGTNTLTVTIADVNDNQPEPGHQDIFVYNYKGKFGNTNSTIVDLVFKLDLWFV